MRTQLFRRILITFCALFGTPAVAETPDENWLELAEAVATPELDDHRGRQDLQIDIDDIEILLQQNKGEQTGQLYGNKLESAATGFNQIATDALNGMTGIATIIQNTGNQVIIQDTTMVNVTFSP